MSAEATFNPDSQELPDPVIEAELNARFEPGRVSQLSSDYLEHGTEYDLLKFAVGRRFILGIIPATSEFADIGRSLETTKFAKAFNRPRSVVYKEYLKCDNESDFIVEIDMTEDQPMTAGVSRVVRYGKDGSSQKSIVDLVVDSADNPWIDEIKNGYFDANETYDPLVAWQRLCATEGVELQPEDSLDIATMAVEAGYGLPGALDGVSLALNHSILRYALANGFKNVVSIQDLGPLSLLQKYGKPFDFFSKLEPHPYGGPYDTIPAYSIVQEGIRRARAYDESAAHVFVDGLLLNEDHLLIEEYMPDWYSNRAVGLPEV